MGRSITIPDEPTEENVKPLLNALVLCVWPERDDNGRRYVLKGIRWRDLFNSFSLSDNDVQPDSDL